MFNATKAGKHLSPRNPRTGSLPRAIQPPGPSDAPSRPYTTLQSGVTGVSRTRTESSQTPTVGMITASRVPRCVLAFNPAPETQYPSLSSVTRRLAPHKRHPPQRRLLDHPDHQGLWSSWSWWCRFPLGSQMEFHEQTWLGKRSSVCPNDQIAVAGSQNIRTDLATWS